MGWCAWVTGFLEHEVKVMSHARVALPSQTIDFRHLIIQVLDIRKAVNNCNESVCFFQETVPSLSKPLKIPGYHHIERVES